MKLLARATLIASTFAVVYSTSSCTKDANASHPRPVESSGDGLKSMAAQGALASDPGSVTDFIDQGLLSAQKAQADAVSLGFQQRREQQREHAQQLIELLNYNQRLITELVKEGESLSEVKMLLESEKRIVAETLKHVGLALDEASAKKALLEAKDAFHMANSRAIHDRLLLLKVETELTSIEESIALSKPEPTKEITTSADQLRKKIVELKAILATSETASKNAKTALDAAQIKADTATTLVVRQAQILDSYEG